MTPPSEIIVTWRRLRPLRSPPLSSMASLVPAAGTPRIHDRGATGGARSPAHVLRGPRGGRRGARVLGRRPRERGLGPSCEWAIQDSNLGPLPYQRSALTD